MDLLLSKLDDINVEVDSTRGTALHCAVRRGNEKIAMKLLTRGADPNRRNRRGYTPIHQAILSAKGIKLLKILIDHGGDIDYPPENGLTPMDLTLLSKHPCKSLYSLLQFKQSLQISRFLWSFACWSKTPIEEIGMLLDHGCNPNMTNSSGWNLLHMIAARKLSDDSIQLAEYLIEAGIDINAQTDEEKYSPLHYAVSTNNSRMTELLVYNNANLLLKNANGETAFMMAMMKIKFVHIKIIFIFALTKGITEKQLLDDKEVDFPNVLLQFVVSTFISQLKDKEKSEIDLLQKTMLEFSSSLSLYDILFMDNMKLSELLKNNLCVEVINHSFKHFFCYFYQYRHKVQTAMRLFYAKKDVLEFFNSCLGSTIPSSGIYHIVSNMDGNSLMIIQRRFRNYLLFN